MAEKCTIKDVALRSRTSVGTVSRYLNGVGCSPERAGRIRKAIKELHYVPNPHAKAVRSSSKGSIGILISSSSIDNTQWINTVIFALIRKCTAMGVFPSIYEVDCKGDGSDCIQAMEKVDGVVMIGDFDLKFFRCFDRFPNLPAVTFCVPVHCANGISLEIEMDTAMEQMIEHLVSLNHRYIGVVSNLIESNRVKDEAFLKAVHRFYPDYDETLIVKGAAEENYGVYGRKYTAKLLDEHPEITAIFYFSDCFLPGGADQPIAGDMERVGAGFMGWYGAKTIFPQVHTGSNIAFADGHVAFSPRDSYTHKFGYIDNKSTLRWSRYHN